MTGHGDACLCEACAPLPPRLDPVQMTSPAYRLERGRQWARAIRLPEDAWEAAAEQYDAVWRREHARDLQAARAEEEQAERWGDSTGSRYGIAALRRMLAGLARHDYPSVQIERVAYSCGRLVAGGELAERAVMRALAVVMVELCLPEDVYAPVVVRALRAGQERPRSAPERAAA